MFGCPSAPPFLSRPLSGRVGNPAGGIRTRTSPGGNRRPCPKTARTRRPRVAQTPHGSGSRRLLPRAFAARLALRWPVLHRGRNNRHLLSPRLSGAHPPFKERNLLSHGRSRTRSGV